jgi:hypothetical protein
MIRKDLVIAAQTITSSPPNVSAASPKQVTRDFDNLLVKETNDVDGSGRKIPR